MKAVIASGHQRVSETVGEILKCGGNAFDAIVAGGFASTVAEPLLTSLGGGGFLLSRTYSGESRLFDFFVDTPGRGSEIAADELHFLPIEVNFPGSVQIFHVGNGSIAVPGVLRGLLHVQRKLGRVPLPEVLAPAIHLARHGVEFNRTQAYILSLLEPIMRLNAGCRQLYCRQKMLLQAGDTFTNPGLADFLSSLAKGGEREFYEGEIARQIIRDMREHGGLLTEKDLAGYRVIERAPLQSTYRQRQILTNPLPSFGGSMLTSALNWLESSMQHPIKYGSKNHLTGSLTLLQKIHECRGKGQLPAMVDTEGKLQKNLAKIRKAFGGTTHISVIDAEGNAAGMTCSNGEGSSYIVAETGIMLNNMMGEDDLHPRGFHRDPPGKRISSMMSPTILLENAQPQLVLGSGGSKRIWSALFQVISNFVDFKMPIATAVAAPRMHWDGTSAQIEPGFEVNVIAALQKQFPVNLWQVRDVYFGGVHAVAGSGHGGGDQRRDGSVLTI